MKFINDNKITKNNIKSILKIKEISLSDEEIQQVVMDYDNNYNSGFDYNLFLSVLKNVVEPKDLPRVFKEFDKDGDNLITKNELRDMMVSLSYEDFTLKDASDLIRRVTNSNEAITYKDFMNLILM